MAAAGPAQAVVPRRPWGWLLLPWLLLPTLPAAAQATVEVSIAQYRFEPAEIRIRPGDSVRWTNHERRTSHSVLFPGENGLESERLFPDESWTRRFDQPGRYEYRCGPHAEMKGTVLVVE